MCLNCFFQLLLKNSFKNDPSLSFPLPRAFPLSPGLSPNVMPHPLCGSNLLPCRKRTERCWRTGLWKTRSPGKRESMLRKVAAVPFSCQEPNGQDKDTNKYEAARKRLERRACQAPEMGTRGAAWGDLGWRPRSVPFSCVNMGKSFSLSEPPLSSCVKWAHL